MTVKAAMPVRFMNLVEPLGVETPAPTAMRSTETGEPLRQPPSREPEQLAFWSGAVSTSYGLGLGRGDVDSSASRRTPRTTPSPRTSSTATRTGTTRTTSSGSVRSADSSPHPETGEAPFTTAAQVHAWECCRKSKRNSASALEFEQDVERRLMRLREALLSRTWRPGRSICFVATHPKLREVWAAPFDDRVVHHLLYNHIGPRIERAFIHNTAACIKNRGTLFAAKRLEHDARSITQNWQHDAFYLKCDLANFFVSIDKTLLQQRLHRLISPEDGDGFWLWLADTILMHDPREDFEMRGDRALFEKVPTHKRLLNAPPLTGLPIGNLPSQFFANVLLDGLDQHVKHDLRMRWYGRYVDDFYILHPSAQRLNEVLADLTAWLPEHLHCELNPHKTVMQPLERGIDFVGQVIKPWRRTPRANTVKTALRRLSDMPAENLFAAGNSYLGLFGQASHGHNTQAKVARLLRRRGHAVAGDLNKVYRRTAHGDA